MALLVATLLAPGLLHPLTPGLACLLALPAGLALLVPVFVRGHVVDSVTALLVTLVLPTLLPGPAVLGPLLAPHLAVGDLAALVVITSLPGLAVALTLLAVALTLLAVSLSLLAETVVPPVLSLLGLPALVSLAALLLVGVGALVSLPLVASLVMSVLGMSLVGLLGELVVAEHLSDLLALTLVSLTGLMCLTSLVSLASLVSLSGLAALLLLPLMALSSLLVLLALLVTPSLLAELALIVGRLVVLLAMLLVLLAVLFACLLSMALPCLVSPALCAVRPVSLLMLALERILVVLLALFLSSALVVRCVVIHGKVWVRTYSVAGQRT